MIRPRQHRDNRIIIMDYEKFPSRASRVRSHAFKKRYVAKADISSCFSSIYTHAIPWSVIGVTAAKKSTKGGWHNDLDFYARRATRDETQGIPIGPASSNIIAEIILSTIDNVLGAEFNYIRGSKNTISRFIDDYSFYCDSYDDAEQFIRRLNEELNSFKLRLNPKKTSIISPTTPFGDIWAAELALRLPIDNTIDAYKSTNYLEFATFLASQNPEGSVLKYAANALLARDLTSSAKNATLDYLLVLAVTNPTLLPSLKKLLDSTKISEKIIFPQRIIDILSISAKRHRSDAMAWTLYYCKKYNITIPLEVAQEVINTKDCIAILALLHTNQHFQK